MRKILSGFLFRLFKGFEIWVLIALLLFAAGYIDFSLMDRENYLNLVHEDADYVIAGEYEYNLEDGGVKAYRFETQGVSALDVYKYGIEELPEDVGKILNGSNSSIVEMKLICFLFLLTFAIPMVLMTIFIPVFFGRMYSDGTIKNLIVCGYSKGKIYLASLVFTYLLDLFLILVNLLVVGLWCLYYEWKPPFYLPVILAMLLSSILLLFTYTTLSLAILFVTSRKTIALVIGLVVSLFVLMDMSSITAPWSRIISSQDSDSKEYIDELREVTEIYSEKGLGVFEQRFDHSEFAVRLYYKGREIKSFSNSSLNPVTKNAYLTSIYMNPSLVYFLVFEDFTLSSGELGGALSGNPTPYMMCRDGIVAINAAANIFWVVLMNGAVLLFVRKREVRG